MEKINLEKVRGHLAALNKELGVKALDEDVIELLGDYIHDFIYRTLENVEIIDYLTDYEFSVSYDNRIEVDGVYLDVDNLFQEIDTVDALKYAIDKYETLTGNVEEEKAVQNLNKAIEKVNDCCPCQGPIAENKTEENGG
jgi:hypothetical protein